VSNRPHVILRFEYHILADDLCDHYRRSGFYADRVAAGLVQVGRTDLADPVEESREAELLLREWGELHPETPAQEL
jgi:hypothetical protein